jgi:hypothetical protein
MIDTFYILVVVTAFLFGGVVKGVIGLGLPSICLALLTLAIDLPSAMALILAPSFFTNIWQIFAGGNTRAIFVRVWPFLSMATVSVWFGAMSLTRLNLELLAALLGLLLIIYAIVNLCGLGFTVKKNHEVWVGPLMGTINGIFAGMTGSSVVPGVMFLQAINLQKNEFIQAMGMLFALSILALAFALGRNNFLTAELAVTSTVAMLPALVGMAIGQKIRQRLPEQLFRNVFFISLLVLGLYILASKIGKVM